MPRPNLGPPEIQVGGYIPFIDIPCERFVGESIAWVIFLSTSGPIICKYIPWLCCPIPFEFDDPDAVSADVDCNEIGARYGATLFWTMQGISVWGLILALANIVRCSVEIGLGIQEAPDTFQDLIPIKQKEAQKKQSFFDLKSKPFRDEFLQAFNHSFVDKSILKKTEREAEQELVKNLGLQNKTEARLSRVKRQSGFLGISIITLDPLYRGADEPPDVCEREEIMHVDGDCHQLMSQGPCEDTEVFLMDPETKKGYCAPRLCNPDRVFVFGDQLCHDPFENDICPSGRQLFSSSFGSPVCGCPYGLYEEDDDLDEDVCKPVLGKIEDCAPGEVFWFTSFRTKPQCLPDPCKGINARKSKDTLPYVPSDFDGKCYQLGKELPQCPDDTFYTLSYSSLKGICASLEHAGYTVLDEDMLEVFSSLYGSRLPRGVSFSGFSSLFSSSSSLSSGKRIQIPDIGTSAVIPSLDPKSNIIPMKIGQPATAHGFFSESDDSSRSPSSSKSDNADDATPDVHVLPTHATAFSPSALSVHPLSPLAKLFEHFFTRRKVPTEESEDNEEQHSIGSRRRRSVLPHASPETVYQSSMAACRAGAHRGINHKCNTKYLPNRTPLSRPKRNIPPISPYPRCPKGNVYTIRRKCVSSERKARDSLLIFGLG